MAPAALRTLAAAMSAALALALGACADDEVAAPPVGAPEPTPTASALAAGPWSFTDDLGVNVALDSRPLRIVAQVSAAATLLDYGIEPVAVFGATVREDGAAENSAGDLADLGDIPSLGSTFGEFNVEALAAANPDLVVTLTYEEDLASAKFDPYWYVPAASQSEIAEIAPLLAIGVAGAPIDTTVDRFAALAGALGADLSSGENATDKADYDSARESLRSAIAAKPGLTALFVSGYAENLYIANPQVAVDVQWFRELGLEVPDVEVEEGEFWEVLSWEQADRHPADLLLNDIRGQALTLEKMTKTYPNFANLPAVTAGQVGKWHFESPYSYESMTEVLRDFTATINAADPDLV